MIRKFQSDEIKPYLKDASNFIGGSAELVVIPESASELIEFLKANRNPISVAGAGTGITAGRIPETGTIISMERFNTIGELRQGSIRIEPGVSLMELDKHLKNTSWFYPPNPTEMLAFIGGTVATNASGSRSFKFGATRNYILELDVALSDGRTVHLKRGRTIQFPLVCQDGGNIIFPETNYQSPAFKNAAGYYLQPNMDWIDLFIGSDGTLGIVTSILLKVLPRPADFLSGVLFFDSEESSWNLVERIRSMNNVKISPCSLEYFDRYSLGRLRNHYPNIPYRAKSALFFEQDISSNDQKDSVLEYWYGFLEKQGILLDDSWFANSPKDLETFHQFRHAIPLLLNEENSRFGRVKIGTDLAVDDTLFIKMMQFYEETLASSGIDYVVFGHIGDNHLHINLMPEKDKTERAYQVYQSLVNQILQWGGTVSAEHGIGCNR